MTELTKLISTLSETVEALKAYQILEPATKLLIPETIEIPDRSYAVGKYPITISQYNYFCESTNRPTLEGEDNFPVTRVNWNDANEYLLWLSNKTGKSYRLPTEDEFEHFCGDHQKAAKDIAVFDVAEVTRVGTKQSNSYGLYDCLGLVWEWQSSKFDERTRVLRGGGWFNDPWFLCSADRLRDTADGRFDHFGFRVLLELY